MNIGEKLSQCRRSLGLTQGDLSRVSGVSVPSIANIELGVANPSLGTILKLFSPLGLELTATPTPHNLDTLCALGLPLTTNSKVAIVKGEEKFTLIRELTRAINNFDTLEPRAQEAIAAMLETLRLYYPSIYKKHFQKSHKDWKLNTGKMIKLINICQSRVSEYL